MTEPLTVKVTLPWPPPALSPNARGHWSKRSKAARRYRQDCCYVAISQGVERLCNRDAIELSLLFSPPDRRHRDDDNLVAAWKAGRDGLADAIGIDDRHFRIVNVMQGAVVAHGEVVVTLHGYRRDKA